MPTTLYSPFAYCLTFVLAIIAYHFYQMKHYFQDLPQIIWIYGALKKYWTHWVAQLVGMSSCALKRLWVWSLVKVCTWVAGLIRPWAMYRRQLIDRCFLLSLFLSFSLSQINKHILGWVKIKQNWIWTRAKN